MEKYLGDLVANDGSNTKNILARKSKGIGIVDQIMTKLRGTVYGPFYFEVGLILREAMLINGILKIQRPGMACLLMRLSNLNKQMSNS